MTACCPRARISSLRPYCLPYPLCASFSFNCSTARRFPAMSSSTPASSARWRCACRRSTAVRRCNSTRSLLASLNAFTQTLQRLPEIRRIGQRLLQVGFERRAPLQRLVVVGVLAVPVLAEIEKELHLVETGHVLPKPFRQLPMRLVGG